MDAAGPGFGPATQARLLLDKVRDAFAASLEFGSLEFLQIGKAYGGATYAKVFDT
jgi:hypothetical protein